jgi:hypothetical protein
MQLIAALLTNFPPPATLKILIMGRAGTKSRRILSFLIYAVGFVSLQYKKTMAPNANPEPFHFFTCQPLSNANSKTINLRFKGRTKIHGHYILSKSESYKISYIGLPFVLFIF